MKIRESHIKYDVNQHGDTYSPQENFGLVCPECYSKNIYVELDENKPYISEHLSDNEYTCKDCGCKFFAWNQLQLTEFGLFLEKLFKTLMVIAFLAIWLFIFIVAYGAAKENNDIEIVGGVGVIVSMVLLALFSNIEEHI